MGTRERGFTLVELMISVGIIAILALLALPAYQDYVARAQAAEGMSLASGAKIAIASYYGDHGLFPPNNDSAGMAAPGSVKGRHVSSVTVGNGDGVIRVAFSSSASAKLQGHNLTFQVTDNSGSLRWACGGLDRKYLPSNCN